MTVEFVVRVFKEGEIEDWVKLEQIVLKSQRAGVGPEAPGQQRLWSWEMQQTTADGCSLADRSSDLGGTTSLQAVIGVEPDNQTSQFSSLYQIVSWQMSWLQVKSKELGNE